MTSLPWSEAKPLLSTLLGLPPEERAQRIEELANGNPKLRAELVRLLDVHAAHPGFLEPPEKDSIERPLREISLAFVGCRLGDFQLEALIGTGGSSSVYRARQISLGRPAAVKLLGHQFCASDNARARFQREAAAASKLRHDAIVSIYSCGEHEGAHYIAMELVEGRTLAELLDERRGRATENGGGLPDAGVVRLHAGWVERIARGLQHCHEHGVVHRDVKPHNIVLDSRGLPRLVDFGVAKLLEFGDATAHGIIPGTLGYMSPEQTRGEAATARSDIYSLGIVLYELLTLRKPFEQAEPAALALAIANERPASASKLNRAVPPGLAAICAKALAKLPAQRYSTAAELADDLERWASGSPPLALERTWSERLSERAPSRKVAAAAAVLLTIGLGSFFGSRAIFAEERPSATPPKLVDARDAEYARAMGLEALLPTDVCPPGTSELELLKARKAKIDERIGVDTPESVVRDLEVVCEYAMLLMRLKETEK